MSLKQNILANYVGSGAVALAPILALPFYLAALGPQQFGFVGFVTTLQAVLNLLDAGMSQALMREISLRASLEGAVKQRTAMLLYGFERIYWALGLMVGLGLLVLAEPITRYWLHLEGAAAANGQVAVLGAAALFATLFPGSLYRSLLVGTERQLALNQILLVATLVRHGGAVLAVMAWPSFRIYLAWHVAAGLFETVLRARVAWLATGTRRSDARWQSDVITQCWPSIAGLAAASGLGALTMQLDKVFLSHLIPLTEFGYYVIASSAAAGVLQLVYPLMQAALPRALRLRHEPIALRRLYGQLLTVITLGAVVGMAAYAICGDYLLRSWLKDAHAADVVYPLLGWLLIGAILNAFYNLGYAHWLVHGKIRRIFQVNLLAGVLCLLIIPAMVSRFGAVGAASGWLVINLVGLAASLPGLLKIDNEH